MGLRWSVLQLCKGNSMKFDETQFIFPYLTYIDLSKPTSPIGRLISIQKYKVNIMVLDCLMPVIPGL